MAEAAETIDHPAWPARTWLLLALGAVFGLGFHLLIEGPHPWSPTDDPWRIAGAAFLATGGIVFAFSLERLRWTWSAGFAAVAGLIMAGLARWNGAPSVWGADEEWHLASALAAIAVAVPLFQAVRDEGSRRIPVRAAHAYAWSNAILWAAAAAFTLASILLMLLLSELFKLIGIHLIADLIDKEWFLWMLGCGALGAGVGILRDRDKVLGALQKVVRAVLSFLAPVLAFGLILFVLALPLTGLRPLWEQTKATTPILLVCIAGAFVLANAAIGNAADEEPAAAPLRWSAAGLAAVMLPLALVAAISTALRIGQYGYTPDRLWAGVFVTIAAAASASYLAALVRGRARWPDAARRANLRLAIGVCLLTLLLALPIVSFGAISARDQVSRLASGKMTVDKFDWAALRFDFGPAGREALVRLAASGPAGARVPAMRALRASQRYDVYPDIPKVDPAQLRLVVDGGLPLPPGLRETLASDRDCVAAPCRIVVASEREVVLLGPSCPGCRPVVRLYAPAPGGGWAPLEASQEAIAEPPPGDASKQKIEIRKVEKRQVFVDGKPSGPVYD
jgi:hypothetical protein